MENKSDWYLPLFAGTEIVRRSGGLTRFPPGMLLGNLPDGYNDPPVGVQPPFCPTCPLDFGERRDYAITVQRVINRKGVPSLAPMNNNLTQSIGDAYHVRQRVLNATVSELMAVHAALFGDINAPYFIIDAETGKIKYYNPGFSTTVSLYPIAGDWPLDGIMHRNVQWDDDMSDGYGSTEFYLPYGFTMSLPPVDVGYNNPATVARGVLGVPATPEADVAVGYNVRERALYTDANLPATYIPNSAVAQYGALDEAGAPGAAEFVWPPQASSEIADTGQCSPFAIATSGAGAMANHSFCYEDIPPPFSSEQLYVQIPGAIPKFLDYVGA